MNYMRSKEQKNANHSGRTNKFKNYFEMFLRFDTPTIYSELVNVG